MTHEQHTLQTWQERAVREPETLLFEGSSAHDTAGRTNESRSFLFSDPVRILEAWTPADLAPVLTELEEAQRSGLWIAGTLAYEAGLHWNGIGTPDHRFSSPLARFGLYREPLTLNALPASANEIGDTPAPLPLCLEMDMSRSAYSEAIQQALAYIAAGDTYQVNLTTAVSTGFNGDLLHLYRALRHQQPAAFGALLHGAADESVLSFSPELFFRIEAGDAGDRRIVTRPMKGTAPLPSAESDRPAAATALAADEKNRAEHIMIVDLLRNDLGRICQPGSVRTDDLFAVEHYPTLLQMTSTVSGTLQPASGLAAVFQSLFPSGSMTGAPKRRTMEVIQELEPHPRGVYSGTVGFAAPDGSAVFSVAIRTAVLRGTDLRMGVGGGIVADSTPASERAECWLKASFLLRASEPFQLFETMRWEGRLHWAAEHMERLARSADALGFDLDPARVLADLNALGQQQNEPCRLKILLDRDGRFHLETSSLTLWNGPARVRLSPERRWSGDRFLRHKTTVRDVYDREHAAAIAEGWDDALFANERDHLTEGAVTSLLVRRDGHWLTPPVLAGVLPGVARSVLLRTGQLQEADIPLSTLHTAEAVALANGVRGIVAVEHLSLSPDSSLRFPTDLPLPVMPESPLL